MANNDLLRTIPKIDKLSQDEKLKPYTEISQNKVNDLLRKKLDSIRYDILAGKICSVPTHDSIIDDVLYEASQWKREGLNPIINATGVVLHTNFGRSPMSMDMLQDALSVCSSYSNLEYNIDEGTRTSRTKFLEEAICNLTGAEDAIVVNNNVAAITLSLVSLAAGCGVALSRGELVEIGGSFRLPEIIEAAGCNLVEVGTTNVTRLDDFEQAVDENVGAFLKVNQSNFAFVGYSEEVSLSDLVELAHKYELPCIYDMGSGLIYNLERFGIDEMTIASALESGVDLITFSCDKLLGGPQAGVIAGKKEFVDKIRKSPLLRAVRVDKFTICSLQSTLRAYESFAKATESIPALNMISVSEEALEQRAECMKSHIIDLLDEKCRVWILEHKILSVEPVEDTPGGGCAPTCTLPGYALCIKAPEPDRISKNLRCHKQPVISLTKQDKIVLSVRTVLPHQEEVFVRRISEILSSIKSGESHA